MFVMTFFLFNRLSVNMLRLLAMSVVISLELQGMYILCTCNYNWVQHKDHAWSSGI